MQTIGSTSSLQYVVESDAEAFIVLTEAGIPIKWRRLRHRRRCCLGFLKRIVLATSVLMKLNLLRNFIWHCVIYNLPSRFLSTLALQRSDR